MSSRAASTSCPRLNVSHLNADRTDRQPGPSPAAPCGVQVPVLFRCFHGGNLGRGAPSARISVMEGSTPYSIKRKEVLPHGISVLFDQRHQPGQHLRHHRSGLHHGVRHRQDAELCPRRYHHDRRLRRHHRRCADGPAAPHRRAAQHPYLCAARRPHRIFGL